MKNKIKYSEGPMEQIKVIADFLPGPEELAFREETVKVTIALSINLSINKAVGWMGENKSVKREE